jgi:predicted DCC family thiol-disulfide oxidoreductase YuxK
MASRRELASLSTVVFLVVDETSPSNQAKHVYVRSDAIVELCRRLGGWRRVASWGRIIPRPLRDALYNFIARRRHKLLQKQACVIPSAELKARTLP